MRDDEEDDLDLFPTTGPPTGFMFVGLLLGVGLAVVVDALTSVPWWLALPGAWVVCLLLFAAVTFAADDLRSRRRLDHGREA